MQILRIFCSSSGSCKLVFCAGKENSYANALIFQNISFFGSFEMSKIILNHFCTTNEYNT